MIRRLALVWGAQFGLGALCRFAVVDRAQPLDRKEVSPICRRVCLEQFYEFLFELLLPADGPSGGSCSLANWLAGLRHNDSQCKQQLAPMHTKYYSGAS